MFHTRFFQQVAVGVPQGKKRQMKLTIFDLKGDGKIDFTLRDFILMKFLKKMRIGQQQRFFCVSITSNKIDIVEPLVVSPLLVSLLLSNISKEHIRFCFIFF